MGKSKCCCTPQIPYLKFMNLTVDGAFQIPSAPTDVPDLDKETVLFRDVIAGCSYCIFGPLKDCFDLETGEFTVKETGLYAITVLPTFEVSANTGCTGNGGPATGDRSVRVNRTYGSASRCGTIPDHLGQTQHIGQDTTLINTLMTYSAVQPLEAGDKLDFRAFQINPDGFCGFLYFEFNIIKLSNASKCLFNPTPTPAPSPLSPCPSPTPDPGPGPEL